MNLDFFNDIDAKTALDKLTAESLAGSYGSMTDLRPTKSINGVQLTVRIALKTDVKEVCSAKKLMLSSVFTKKVANKV